MIPRFFICTISPLFFLKKYNIFESSIWTQLIDSQKKKKKKEQLIIAHKAKNVVTQLETQDLNFFIPIYWIIKKKNQRHTNNDYYRLTTLLFDSFFIIKTQWLARLNYYGSLLMKK